MIYIYWSIGFIAAIIWLRHQEQVTLATLIAFPFVAAIWPVVSLVMLMLKSEDIVLWRKKD